MVKSLLLFSFPFLVCSFFFPFLFFLINTTSVSVSLSINTHLTGYITYVCIYLYVTCSIPVAPSHNHYLQYRECFSLSLSLFPFLISLSLSPPMEWKRWTMLSNSSFSNYFRKTKQNKIISDASNLKQKKKKKVTGNYAKNAQLSIIFLCPQTHAKTQTQTQTRLYCIV